ncbi:MAG: MarR family transcriptional regulator [Burkholderiaceae bacterium]
MPTRSLDHESRVDDGDHRALKLWLRLLTCSNLIETRVRSRLRGDFDCTLPRFDLVAQLDRHPDGLKMGELSKRLMVTGGNITGLTDQLESDGWVERTGVDNDRRAWRVRLTPRGKKAFRQMAAVHERWIAELFAEWGERDQDQLYKLLGKLKDAVHVTASTAKDTA